MPNIIMADPKGVDSLWELIGEETFENVSEWTDTASKDTLITGINISNTNYAWILVIVTCDTPILTANEWGMTMALGGRYTSNSAFYLGSSTMQKGSATTKFSDMVSGTTNASSYGVSVPNNKSSVTIERLAHATACPKVRAGNYTVKAYGLKSLG